MDTNPPERAEKSETRLLVEESYLSNIDGQERLPSLWQLKRREKVLLACLVFGVAESYISLSLLAPFYPGEAYARGVSQKVAGLVFAVFSLTQFLSAPVFGKAVSMVGVRPLYLTGAAVCGVASILFGFLGWLPHGGGNTVFVSLSFLLRVAMSLGATAWVTEAYVIAMKQFKGHSSTVAGLLETGAGVGMMAGPPLGGFLYHMGGFLFPFLFSGILTITLLPLFYFILGDTFAEETPPTSMMLLIKIPFTWLILVSCFGIAILFICLDPILELHLEKFGLSVAQVGLVFLLFAGSYTLSAPLCGWLIDYVTDSRPFVSLSYVFVAAGFFFLGPSPLTPLVHHQHLWWNLSCLCVIGVFGAMALVPIYMLLNNCSRMAGMPDNVSTHGALSGLFTSAYALGETVGPVASAWLTEDFGFAWCTSVFSLVALVLALVFFIHWSLVKNISYKADDKSLPTKDEYIPLIQSSQ